MLRDIIGKRYDIESETYGGSCAPLDNDYALSSRIMRMDCSFDRSAKAAAKRSRVDGLFLHQGLGWPCESLRVLDGMQNLKLLSVMSQEVISGASSIMRLPKLEALSLDCRWDGEIDFRKIPALWRLSITWHESSQGISSIFGASQLRCLSIFKLNNDDLGDLESLEKLELLKLEGGNFNRLDLENRCLRKVVAIDCKSLKSIRGITNCTNVEWLTLSGCKKISDFSPISELPRLRVLQLSFQGKIESIDFVRDLKNLEAVSFYGDTSFVDGDLSVLENLPKLRRVGFVNRRHYSHKVREPWSWVGFDDPKVSTCLIRK
ncbi:MAG: leucine-rich repeat domain-containing protein [Verrucomicrobiales bacterium]